MSGGNEAAGVNQGSTAVRSGLDVGKLVAGGLTVVSTAIAIVGGVTGAVTRFLRNHPVPLLLALFLSVAAVGVSLAGSQWAASNASAAPREPAGISRTRQFASKLWSFVPRLFRRIFEQLWRFVKNPTTISFILFSAAVLLTVYYLEQSISSSDRPRITSTWTDIGTQAVLSVVVKTPVPVTRMPDNTLTPVFSCVTTFAPHASPLSGPPPASPPPASPPPASPSPGSS